MRKNKIKISIDEFKKLYFDQQLTTCQIAEKLGCGHTTVSNFMKRNNIQGRPRHPQAKICPHNIYKKDCKKCKIIYAREYRIKHQKEINRKCKNCHKNFMTKDGRIKYCSKKCREELYSRLDREYMRRRRKDPNYKMREKEWRQNNPEKMRKYQKKCYQKHREQRLFENKKWCQNHQKQRRIHRRKYYERHKKEIIDRLRRTQLTTTINGENVNYYYVKKRPYPKDGKCELCKIHKPNAYHHWRIEKEIIYGLWICGKGIIANACHAICEMIDKIGAINLEQLFQKVINKYRELLKSPKDKTYSHLLILHNKKWIRVKTRPKPKSCELGELCIEKLGYYKNKNNELKWHHPDDNRPDEGVWTCWACHYLLLHKIDWLGEKIINHAQKIGIKYADLRAIIHPFQTYE